MQCDGGKNKKVVKNIIILFSVILLVDCLFGVWATADDHGKNLIKFWDGEHHHSRSGRSDDEGNETAGLIAAWLLLAANLPVIISLLIKLTNRFTPVSSEIKEVLGRANRFQKKHLMIFHYYLNLVVLIIATWHWISSRCKSSALPELGFIMLVTLISFGALMKFGLCPSKMRKGLYKIHTQPIFFLSLITVLLIGHIIVD